ARAGLVWRPDGFGGPPYRPSGAAAAADQGPLRGGLRALALGGRVRWAGAGRPAAGGAAPGHEAAVLELWPAGAHVLVRADPPLSPLRADRAPGPPCGAPDRCGGGGTGDRAGGLGPHHTAGAHPARQREW